MQRFTNALTISVQEFTRSITNYNSVMVCMSLWHIFLHDTSPIYKSLLKAVIHFKPAMQFAYGWSDKTKNDIMKSWTDNDTHTTVSLMFISLTNQVHTNCMWSTKPCRPTVPGHSSMVTVCRSTVMISVTSRKERANSVQ